MIMTKYCKLFTEKINLAFCLYLNRRMVDEFLKRVCSIRNCQDWSWGKWDDDCGVDPPTKRNVKVIRVGKVAKVGEMLCNFDLTRKLLGNLRWEIDRNRSVNSNHRKITFRRGPRPTLAISVELLEMGWVSGGVHSASVRRCSPSHLIEICMKNACENRK